MEHDIAAYAALQKELLELEREEEKLETVASADGHRLSVLEASGLAISRLSLQTRSSDAAGRQILHLVPRGGRTLSGGRISTGDIVGLRDLSASSSSTTTTVPDANSATALLAEGIVTALDAHGLHVTVDRPLGDDVDGSASFVALKLGSDVTHVRYTRALSELARAADDLTHASHNLVRALFGAQGARFAKRDAALLPPDVAAPLHGLNEAQGAAVRNALAARDVAVIHGPPGTGKTHALTAYVRAEAARGSRLLLVAPSNVAIDTLAERLAATSAAAASSGKPLRFVRAGHPARVLPAVQPYTLDAQLAATDEMKLARDVRAELDALEARACGCTDRAVRRGIRGQQRLLRRELRERERAALQRLMKRTPVVLATISGAGARVLDVAAEFDVVVVDEAAQALEAAVWAALLRGRKAVLAGDPYQLGGLVRSAQAVKRGLQRSVLDRVFGMPALDEAIVMLATQYRMHATISDWSSGEFYKGALQAHESVAARRVADLDGLGEGARDDEQMVSPFILIDTAGGDCEEDAGADNEKNAGIAAAASSRSNEGEAAIAAEVVGHFLSLGLGAHDVGVISPYSGQVELLRSKLWGAHGRALEVATVDSFQGREKEVIVLSLVRSNEAGDVGFLADDRRLNVAITRAKRCVLVIADSETVSSHPLLERLVDYVERCGVVRSAVVDFPDVVGTDSALRRPREAIEAETRASEARKGGTKQARKPGARKPARARVGKGKEESLQELLKRAVTIGDDGAASGGGVDAGAGVDAAVAEARERLGRQLEKFAQNEFVVEKVFSTELSSLERRVVHEVAEELGLHHASSGAAEQRRIRVWKADDGLAAMAAVLEREMDAEIADEIEASDGEPGDDAGGWCEPVGGARFAGLEAEGVEADEAAGGDEAEAEEREGADEYAGNNSLLRELRQAREKRQEQEPPNEAEAQHEGGSSRSKKKRGRRKKKGQRDKESDDEFDAVLAQYGAPKAKKHPVFSPAVAQIVNGTLQAGSSAQRREPTREQRAARERLQKKLAREGERRKRKVKSKDGE